VPTSTIKLNYSNNSPIVVGHRGARNIAPENTLESIKAALNLRLAAIEFDVTYTKDRAAVIVHQETVQPDFNTHSLKLAGREAARLWAFEHTLEEIRSLDAGGWHAQKFRGVKVPTLEEIFSLNWGESYAVMELIDPSYWIEPVGSGDNTVARTITQIVRPEVESFLTRGGNLFVLSFNPKLLAIWQAEFSGIPRILAVWTNENGNATRVIEQARCLGVHAVTLADSMVLEDPAWLKLCRKAGIRCWVYEVTPDNEKDFYSWSAESRKSTWEKLIRVGVDGIESDFPDVLQQWTDTKFR